MSYFVIWALSLLFVAKDAEAFVSSTPPRLERQGGRRKNPCTRELAKSSRSSLEARRRNKSDSIEPLSFAMSPSRRTFVVSTFSFGLMAGALVGLGMVADAKYGVSSNMELPNYIDYLIEKNEVPDNSKVLYKGADPSTLLRRLQDAERRLQEIDSLAEQKKWTQINGIVTGPLGTLSMTLSQIASPESSPALKTAAKKLKADVLAIGQAADKKNGNACSNQAALARQDLKSFLEIAFD
mmetsp:Transcript_19832/g.31996  ORF Transcript_19832/g.31996 Transcript_19832/m.31996 type:complete len:239 (+) Transcript_19832:83-799(+)